MNNLFGLSRLNLGLMVVYIVPFVVVADFAFAAILAKIQRKRFLDMLFRCTIGITIICVVGLLLAFLLPQALTTGFVVPS